jgi:GDP-L-fucose synthase
MIYIAIITEVMNDHGYSLRMRILLTGSSGMLGSAIHEAIIQKKPHVEIFAPSSSELNLLDSNLVQEKIAHYKPDQIIHCAAKVGGIQANIDDPFSYFFSNVRMDSNLINAAKSHRVNSFLYFGSSCMYPADTSQPILESQILTGALEKTNEGYALAKILATKLISTIATQFKLDWHVLILSNLYGPGDKYSEGDSHLVAAVIQKIDAAIRSGSNTVEMWGDGLAKREFTYVNDVASFVVSKIGETKSMPSVMNLGAGKDCSVRDYYEKIAQVMGFGGEIISLPGKPVGMKRKLMDSEMAASHGWNPKTDLDSGLLETIERYREDRKELDGKE